MGATLSLGKTARMPEPEKPITVFDPEAHYGEVGGVEGVTYVQGKSLFNRAKQFVREAPKEMWLAPLTPEQEQKRKQQMLSNKRFFTAAAPKAQAAAMPQKILDAERENARARAAETQAA